MSGAPFYEYASSTHPVVLKAARINYERDREYRAGVKALGEELGATRNYQRGGLHTLKKVSIIAFGPLDDAPTLGGRWKRYATVDGFWLPWANNPIATRIALLEYTPVPLPGFPTSAWRSGFTDGRMANTQWFLHDGTVYAHLSNLGDKADLWGWRGTYDEYGWAELTGTQYRTAMDSYNEAARTS